MNPPPQATDLIPEFARLVHEAQPRWLVMENVMGARKSEAIPRSWWPAKLRDWDCGGHTFRKRLFWTWPFALLEPSVRPGRPQYSVLKHTAKKGGGGIEGSVGRRYVTRDGRVQFDASLNARTPIEELARLQGDDRITPHLLELGATKRFVCAVLGEGVPLAMGRYVAAGVRMALESAPAAVA